jgi:hypothetical protein
MTDDPACGAARLSTLPPLSTSASAPGLYS